MARLLRFRACAIVLSLLFVSTPASARTTFLDLPVEEAAKSDIGEMKLLDVPFYMKGQRHPGVAKDLGVFKTNKRTNAVGKSDERGCQVAFLSAIIQLQVRAQKQGGNAVVDIRSITKHNDLESASKYRCAAGTFVANVALTGRVVKLAK